MDALIGWNALSSGNGAGGMTRIPGALLDLLKVLGDAADNLAKLIGLVA